MFQERHNYFLFHTKTYPKIKLKYNSNSYSRQILLKQFNFHIYSSQLPFTPSHMCSLLMDSLYVLQIHSVYRIQYTVFDLNATQITSETVHNRYVKMTSPLQIFLSIATTHHFYQIRPIKNPRSGMAIKLKKNSANTVNNNLLIFRWSTLGVY